MGVRIWSVLKIGSHEAVKFLPRVKGQQHSSNATFEFARNTPRHNAPNEMCHVRNQEYLVSASLFQISKSGRKVSHKHSLDVRQWLVSDDGID